MAFFIKKNESVGACMDSLKFTSEESSEVLSEFVRPDLHAYTRSSEVLSEFV